MDVLVLHVPTIPNPCSFAFSCATRVASAKTSIPCVFLPSIAAESFVSCVTTIGSASGAIASPFVVTLMIPWLFPRNCAYMSTSKITLASFSLYPIPRIAFVVVVFSSSIGTIVARVVVIVARRA